MRGISYNWGLPRLETCHQLIVRFAPYIDVATGTAHAHLMLTGWGQPEVALGNSGGQTVAFRGHDSCLDEPSLVCSGIERIPVLRFT